MKIDPRTTRLGWIGTGVMGASMCGHLIAAGFQVKVYSRTRSKVEPLLARGDCWAGTPKAVADACNVVFTMVGYPADVRAVILGDDGVLAGLKAGGVVVDMTTSQPSLAVEIAEAASRRGVFSLDAPVSGGDLGAREARLSIMIGGDKAAADALAPCFQAMGKTIVYQGGPGSGQHTKLVNQVTIAGTMVGVCEALLYGYRAGLDLTTVMQSIASGAAASWSLSNLARGSSPTTSIRAFSSSISSRTWASLWTSRNGWAWHSPAWRWFTNCISRWPRGPCAERHASPPTGAGRHVRDQLGRPAVRQS